MMGYEIENIKEGIKLHCIETEKYKTDLTAIILTVPLKRESVTLDSLIPAVLRRGSFSMPTQEKISEELEKMYGAAFDCGIEKIGDNHIIKFYIESLSDMYISGKQELLKQNIEKLLEIVFNPFLENGTFKEEYVLAEKNNIKMLIESKIDNKDAYSWDRCVEEMYKGKEYGIYKYGYVEDLEKIDAKSLYNNYKQLLNNCKIDIFVSGNYSKQEISEFIANNENIKKLTERKPNYIINNEETEKKEILQQEKTIEEKMNVAQGKLVIGLDIDSNNKEDRFITALYNVILGESATSKLFQNVREKASLAYSARSNYIRQKNNIYIRCGIEVENYQKAIDIIKQQLEDMKIGNFTQEDIENAKKYMVAGIKTVQDEQDSEITYYIGQEISNYNTSFEEYIEKIQKVTKEQVQEMANKIKLNTIYFLRN